MPHRDHEPGAEEEVELAEDDLVRRRVVAGGPVDDEVEVVVGLDLRPLVRDGCVLDGELVKAEVLSHLGHQLPAGLVELDPDKAVAATDVRCRLFEGLRVPGLPGSARVVGAIDHACQIRRRRLFAYGANEVSARRARRKAPAGRAWC